MANELPTLLPILKIADPFSTELTNYQAAKFQDERSVRTASGLQYLDPRVSHCNTFSVFEAMVAMDGEAVYPPGKTALIIRRAGAARNEGIMCWR